VRRRWEEEKCDGKVNEKKQRGKREEPLIDEPRESVTLAITDGKPEENHDE
jgi:hypothetical protein